MSSTVSDRDFRDLVTEAPVPVVLHFAGPDEDLGGVLDAAAQRFGAALRIGTILAADNPGLCRRHAVIAPPMLVVFRHGEEVARRFGRGLTETDLIAWLTPFAEESCGCDRCR